MKLYWDEWGDLAFTVYRKDGQLLKYLNADSTHPPHVFRAVPHSVLARLANLTTLTKENGNKTMKEIHPDHINALEAANLDINALQKRNKSNKAPTLLEMKENIHWSLASREARDKKDKDRMRGVFSA
jgi:hypothetical protein